MTESSGAYALVAAMLRELCVKGVLGQTEIIHIKNIALSMVSQLAVNLDANIDILATNQAIDETISLV